MLSIRDYDDARHRATGGVDVRNARNVGNRRQRLRSGKDGGLVTTPAAPREIVCVTTEHAHRHIVKVGIGALATSPTTTMTVKEVRDALTAGEIFYTWSPTTKEVALVQKHTCKERHCTVQTIRSTADAVPDNNLDNLAVCP